MMFSRAAVAGCTFGGLALNTGNFVEEMGGTAMVSVNGSAYQSAVIAMVGAAQAEARGYAGVLRRAQFSAATVMSVKSPAFITRRVQFSGQSEALFEGRASAQVRRNLMATALTRVLWDMQLDYRYLRPTDRDRCRQIPPRKIYVLGKEDRRIAVNHDHRTISVARDRETI
jgi:hypothetical protein